MAALAKPFAFDDLDAAPPAREPVFSAADVIAAREKAQADAAASLLVAEAGKQTRLLQAIADQLEAMAADRESALSAEIDALMEAARVIVRKICINLAAAQQADAALELLNQHLSKITDGTPAVIAIPAGADAETATKIEKSVSERGVSEFVSVETRSDIVEGDCRIEWRNGTAAINSENILRQIDSIFTTNRKTSGKGRAS